MSSISDEIHEIFGELGGISHDAFYRPEQISDASLLTTVESVAGAINPYTNDSKLNPRLISSQRPTNLVRGNRSYSERQEDFETTFDTQSSEEDLRQVDKFLLGE